MAQQEIVKNLSITVSFYLIWYFPWLSWDLADLMYSEMEKGVWEYYDGFYQLMTEKSGRALS
jgi:hypothetical protein